jgi:hypothetical protein
MLSPNSSGWRAVRSTNHQLKPTFSPFRPILTLRSSEPSRVHHKPWHRFNPNPKFRIQLRLPPLAKVRYPVRHPIKPTNSAVILRVSRPEVPLLLERFEDPTKVYPSLTRFSTSTRHPAQSSQDCVRSYHMVFSATHELPMPTKPEQPAIGSPSDCGTPPYQKFRRMPTLSNYFPHRNLTCG